MTLSKKTRLIVLGIIFLCIIIILFFTPIGNNILKRSKDTIWKDKSGQYAVIISTITSLDSCNTLSIITRTQNFRRLDCVSKIGDNDHFIIAETINTKKIEHYWIINKDKDVPELSATQSVEGPFSLEKFNERKKELKIDSLNFQKDL